MFKNSKNYNLNKRIFKGNNRVSLVGKSLCIFEYNKNKLAVVSKTCEIRTFNDRWKCEKPHCSESV